MSSKWPVAGTIAVLVTAVMALSVSVASAAGGPAGVLSSTSDVVSPDGALAPAAPLSAAQRAAMERRLQARREGASSSRGVGNGRAGAGASSPQTVERADSEANSVTKNFRNTRAQAVSSTLAEPVAANDGVEVFYGGNTYFSTSLNSGFSWSAGVIPGGPADAPFACCDQDAVRHAARDTTFHSLLYTNSAQTNGVIRIFVRRTNISGGVDCSYTIDPGGAGTLLPDYPHIAVSNNFLYLTTNNINSAGSWTGAQIRRFNVAQMSSCLSTTQNIVTYVGSDGQRVLTPAENATTTEYFGLNRTASLFRIVRWPESVTTVSLFDRTLPTASNFTNPDCRGGTGNFDFIERSTSWSIAGFRLRGAVVPGNRLWFLWNVNRDASHLQAHLHSAIFTEPGLALLSSPAVFNNTRCFGYPTLGANAFGEFGLSFAHGGKLGGGGFAAQGAIAVDDAGSAGNTFASFSTTAVGTHNRSDSRYGDYFTVRRNSKCPTTSWSGTNYSLLNGNTGPANVNARYVEFQSSLHAACP
jgi:hypothetical protein